jgi:hypothetical protein
MTTARSLERRGAFTLACIMALLVIALLAVGSFVGFAVAAVLCASGRT